MDEEKGKSCNWLGCFSKPKPKPKPQHEKSIVIVCPPKTTLLAYLNNKFLHNSYDLVISIYGSRFLTLSSLLSQIAKQIGDPGWNQKRTDDEKRKSISTLLSGKRYAILIDDFYFSADVDVLAKSRLGLPLQNECKIIFFYELLWGYNCPKSVPLKLEPLEWDDSWCLFKLHIGQLILQNPEISSFAAEIVLLCQGLPEALVKIGGLMKCNTTLQEWQNAFQILRIFDQYVLADTTFSRYYQRREFEDVAQVLCDELGKNSMFKERVVAQRKPYCYNRYQFRKIECDLGELKDALAQVVMENEAHKPVIEHSIDFVEGLSSYTHI